MGQKNFLKHYRPNVGIVLFNQQGLIFLGRRAGNISSIDNGGGDCRWQLPQGGIDEGEEFDAAAFRELREETGVTSARLLLLTPGWVGYDFPDGYKHKGWRGQRQKWAAMLFEGKDNEIDLTLDNHQEFDDWRWAELEEAPTLIVPFKRAVYADLQKSLTPLRDFLSNK